MRKRIAVRRSLKFFLLIYLFPVVQFSVQEGCLLTLFSDSCAFCFCRHSIPRKEILKVRGHLSCG
jgi:hypothetical protein